jgi:hypothetical protein
MCARLGLAVPPSTNKQEMIELILKHEPVIRRSSELDAGGDSGGRRRESVRASGK